MSESPVAVFARLNDPKQPASVDALARLDTAVVLGGSIAGLLVARVLSDHADTVVVIEVDDPGTSTEPRHGVPQGSHVHALLPGGLAQLERWFPGFTGQALVAGACPAPAETRLQYVDGVSKVPGSYAPMISGSRPFLEALIRRRVLALPNVKTITARATGLEFDDDAVTGVHYEFHGQPARQHADLVVDAMGRSSRLGDWLEKAGWERPAMRRMTVDLNYSTAVLRRDPGDPGNLVSWSRSSLELDDATGGAAHIEGDRWLMTMIGYRDNWPGRTPEDLVRRAHTEFPPEFAKIADKEMIGDIQTYRQADSRRRDFHAMDRFPARLVAVGDAVASFNPVYGQGMTSAALQVSCLSEYLRSGPDLTKPARGFFDLQRVVVDAAWEISTGADLALPHVDGPYPRGYRLQSWFTRQIVMASIVDRVIGKRFDEVAFMLAHPRTMAKPSMLVRAILVNIRNRKRRRSTT